MPQQHSEVTMVTTQDPFTHVRVQETVRINNQSITIVGEGFAKRNSKDPIDPHIGIEIARARAYDDVKRKRQLIKAAWPILTECSEVVIKPKSASAPKQTKK